jgi:hypothetical protein
MLTKQSSVSSDTAASGDAESGNNSRTQIAKKGIWISLWEARSFWVSVWIVMWVLLFSGGTLIETVLSRVAIGPVSTVPSFKGEVLQRIVSLTGIGNVMDGEATVDPAKQTYQEELLRSKLISWSKGLAWYEKLWHFVLCLLFYTPINLAILSFLSGMIGGFSSNFSVETMEKAGLPLSKERKMYLSEPPLTAAIRGFLAYVCFIAGVYVVMNDPFNETSTGQYLKVAGTMTAVAFSFGYDPTKIGQLLNLIPGSNPGSDTDKAT